MEGLMRTLRLILFGSLPAVEASDPRPRPDTGATNQVVGTVRAEISKERGYMTKRIWLPLVVMLGLAAPVMACPLTEPTITAWQCEDYYGSGHQWSCFGVTAQGPNPFPTSVDLAELQQSLWYYSVREDGSRVEISLNPPNPPQAAAARVTVTHSHLANGCYQVQYTIQGVKDFPNVSSACEENPIAPASCAGRIKASFPAEATGWSITDLAGKSSGNVDGAPCITQGPPHTLSNRGALCMNR